MTEQRYYYILTVDGDTIIARTDKTKLSELHLHNVGSKYQPDDFYITGTKNIFILMDNENDLDYPGKGLPLNKALQKIYPNSKITGEIILTKIDDNDDIISEYWNLSELSTYEYRETGVLDDKHFTFWPIDN